MSCTPSAVKGHGCERSAAVSRSSGSAREILGPWGEGLAPPGGLTRLQTASSQPGAGPPAAFQFLRTPRCTAHLGWHPSLSLSPRLGTGHTHIPQRDLITEGVLG